MLSPSEPLITEPEHVVIRAHYESAGLLMDRHFHGTPLVAVTYPRGLGDVAIFHKSVKTAPPKVKTIPVRTSSGVHSYLQLDLHNMTWLVAGRYAVEFHSWTPIAGDPERAAFARLSLTAEGATTDADLARAAQIVLEALERDHDLHALPMLNGQRDIALWIPFDDAPHYDDVRAWLRSFTERTAAEHADILTVEWFVKDRGDRIYLGTRSNEPGGGSILPYSLRGTPQLEVAFPCPADELTQRRNGDVTAASFATYEKQHGDEFDKLRKAIPEQHFAALHATHMAPRRRVHAIDLDVAPHDARSYIINAAIAVLADGKRRDAAAILDEALRRGLVPKSTTRKYLYTALHEYILRTEGAGRIPEMVQLEHTAEFRINRPADDWPDVELPPLPAWFDEEEGNAAIEKLRQTSTGEDPTAFEKAACEAFALLGFDSEHIGGNAQPDGILTAPLGQEAYRVVLECKTASEGGIVNNPRPEEAAKFRSGHNAEHSILLGPAFAHTQSFDDELKMHEVALWTVDDVARAITEAITPDELREALAPGPAQRALDLIIWNRNHGRRKRVAVIAALIERLGWHVQCTFAKGMPREETPALTEEALFVLISAELVTEGVTAGATRAEAEDALRTCESRGTISKTESGYIVTTPAPQAAPLPMSTRCATDDPRWSLAQYLLTILGNEYEPVDVEKRDAKLAVPRETQAALTVRLQKFGIDIDSADVRYTCLYFFPGSMDQREAYYVTAAAEDPLRFYGRYFFEGARRLATDDGPSRIDVAMQS